MYRGSIDEFQPIRVDDVIFTCTMQAGATSLMQKDCNKV